MPKLCPNRICWSRLGCLLSEKQIPQIAVNIWNRRKTMEPLEPTQAPWAQGVVSSNLAAPTNRISGLERRSKEPARLCDAVCDVSATATSACLLPEAIVRKTELGSGVHRSGERNDNRKSGSPALYPALVLALKAGMRDAGRTLTWSPIPQARPFRGQVRLYTIWR